MASSTVIVFGPTGNIASVAARTAQELGAKVVLAMRDPQKSIPGLSAEQEKCGFERVQADLTQPDTVSAAVRKSGAKRAFFYLAFGMPDHMKSTLQALKSAGIEFVVFLSSYTLIKDDLREIEQSDIIPHAHAQVELNLQEVFGKENYVAVRPGGFATNTLWWSHGIKACDLKLPYPEARFDYITPLDMGRVSGTILVKGQQEGKHFVYLFGPEMVSQREGAETIGRALNKNIDITPLYGDEAVEHYKNFVPEPLAKYLIKKYGDIAEGFDSMTDRPWYEEGKGNIQKYSGKPPMKFEEWVRENKQLFTA